MANPGATYSEAYIEFDGYEVRAHRLANRPTMLFSEGPLSGDRLGESASGIERKSKGL